MKPAAKHAATMNSTSATSVSEVTTAARARPVRHDEARADEREQPGRDGAEDPGGADRRRLRARTRGQAGRKRHQLQDDDRHDQRRHQHGDAGAGVQPGPAASPAVGAKVRLPATASAS